MSNVNTDTIHATSEHVVPQASLGFVGTALLVPVIGGTVLFFVKSFGLALAISAATVVTSAALVAIDASRLGRVDKNGKKRESAAMLFIGMCLMWIVVYPIAFFRRRSFGGPNLGFVSMIVAAFFLGGPILGSLLIPHGLPSCMSPEVTTLLDQVIRNTPVGAHLKSIDSHRELAYDRDADIRQGECVAHTDAGDIPIKFNVEWQDRKKGLFLIRIPPADLPPCTGLDVVKLLEQVIRRTPIGAELKSIDGHRELSYDRDANIRKGECVVHTDTGDIPVRFIVEWQDINKGLFQVRTLPTSD